MKGKVNEGEQSEFNSAIATLMRIDKIKRKLILSTIHQNYDMHWRYLKAYFKELIPIMNETDDDTQKKRVEEVKAKFLAYKILKQKGSNKLHSEMGDILDVWEIELRDIEQRYGMNMPKGIDPRYALASGGRR